MELETVNKLYLELSQFASAETARERTMREALENLRRGVCPWGQIAEGNFITGCKRVTDDLPGKPQRDFKFCPWCGLEITRPAPTHDHDGPKD